MKIMKFTVPILTLILSLSLPIAALAGSGTETSSYENEFSSCVESIERFESEKMPYYNRDVDQKNEIEVWFINGYHDVAYVSIDTMIDILKNAYQEFEGFDLTLSHSSEDEERSFVLTRENGSSLIVDFESAQLIFSDIDQFTVIPGAVNGLDVVELTANGADGNMFVTHSSRFYKNANKVTINMDRYRIPVVFQDSTGYLPLQTIADFLISRRGLYLLYNGESVILTDAVETSPSGEASVTTLGDLYFSASPAKKSDMLQIFNYNELCMALDYSYGLKEEHEISSFKHLFNQTCLTDELCSENAADTYSALSTLTYGYFADLHSGVDNESFMAMEEEESSSKRGFDYQSYIYSQQSLSVEILC